jgi:hypothetical protein
MFLNNNFFWAAIFCSPETARSFAGTYHLHLQWRRENQAINKLTACSCWFLSRVAQTSETSGSLRITRQCNPEYSTESQPKGLQIQHYLFYSTTVRVRSFTFCGLDTSFGSYPEIIPEFTRLFWSLLEFLEWESAHPNTPTYTVTHNTAHKNAGMFSCSEQGSNSCQVVSKCPKIYEP